MAYDDAVDGYPWVKNTDDDWVTHLVDLNNCHLCETSAGGNLAYHAGLRFAAMAGELESLIVRGFDSATNRLITSKDHASVQIKVGHLGPNGVFTVMFAILAEIFAAPPLPSWLIEDDINYYAANFEEMGFTGGLIYNIICYNKTLFLLV
ncbi:hypothetical protein CASFOL_030669 [Castilleja foliolosa]|uniref:Uncharacterized protein n=1 Tax=Castilleja foliolosa TaxID=1961234 RepID=A0ABD3C5Z4_9LAMI